MMASARLHSMRALTPGGFVLRLAVALVLVLATYNPTPYSYYGWLRNTGWNWTPPIVFVGVVLLIAWVIFMRATLRSIGALGLILAGAFFAALFWLLGSWGWLPLDSTNTITWIALVTIAGILAIGVSWSHLRRRWSGQADVLEHGER
jgi:hypothetical protein